MPKHATIRRSGKRAPEDADAIFRVMDQLKQSGPGAYQEKMLVITAADTKSSRKRIALRYHKIDVYEPGDVSP